MNINEKMSTAILSIGRLMKQEMHTSNCLSDFTFAEMQILKFLHNKKSTTMRTIADHLHIKPSSTTTIVDNLAEKGVIKRIYNSKDRRIIYIELTSKGLKALQKTHKNIQKTIKNIFGKLSEADKKNLINIFKKIHEENK